MYRGFMLSFQVTRRRADRTTFACNTHCCLVGQLYIEYYVYSIFNGSNFVTILPPLKIHVIPLACLLFQVITFWHRLVPFVQDVVISLCSRMCLFTSQALEVVLASVVLLSQLDNDCRVFHHFLSDLCLLENPITSRVTRSLYLE